MPLRRQLDSLVGQRTPINFFVEIRFAADKYVEIDSPLPAGFYWYNPVRLSPEPFNICNLIGTMNAHLLDGAGNPFMPLNTAVGNMPGGCFFDAAPQAGQFEFFGIRLDATIGPGMVFSPTIISAETHLDFSAGIVRQVPEPTSCAWLLIWLTAIRTRVFTTAK